MKYKGIKKLYYSISEISDMLGVKQSVIRYWESEFKELKPQKNRAGNRIYKKDDIAIIRLIHHYVYERHLSIHEANEVITDLKKDGLYKRKLQEVNSVELKPAPPCEEVDDEDVDQTLDLEEKDMPEAEAENEASEETKPKFEIVTPTQETFIYPLDEQDATQEPEDSSQKEGSASTKAFPATEAVEDKTADKEEIEVPVSKPEPKEESKPEPVVEVPKQHDPELKELLKKISRNIKDIIDILNE